MCQWQCPKLASTRVLVYMRLYFMLPEQLVTYILLKPPEHTSALLLPPLPLSWAAH